ncbi:MAG TPA: ABC transporter permease [Gemmatimonadaceae bacterium]|nr:ABC transporter permease [Gemmatimonadaceae bacterium]
MRVILFRLGVLVRRLYARLGRAGRTHELSEELAFHVELLTRDGVARGLSPEDARAAALRQFGNRAALAEQAHDMWSLGWLDQLLRDARIAVRGFRRTPTFAVTAVLILGLGIGMATAMFTVFHAVVLRQLPVLEPDRIVTLWMYRDPTVELPLTATEVEALRRESRTMRDIAGTVHFGASVTSLREGDRTLVMKQAAVTANFFDVLGAHPVLGRLLRPEDRDATSHVTVLSYRAWQQQFGGDPHVVGMRLTTTTEDQGVSTVVGVAPPGLDEPTGVDYWTATPAGSLPGVGFDIVARLAPGATPAAARAEFFSLVQRLDRQQQVSLHPAGASVRTLAQAVLGNARPILIVLTAAVALLLLIACVNVGNLLLLRAALRKREMVIRRALGASAGQIARLLLVESALLGLAGGVLGLISADILLHILLAAAPAELPRMDMIDLAGTPVGVAAAVTLLAVLIFGVLPALAAAHGNLASALRLDSRSGGETRQRRRIRQWLVASQVALAVILLAGAGLLVRSLAYLDRIDLGYTSEHLSILELAIPFANYTSLAKFDAMYDELNRRLRAVPGVTAETPVLLPPFVGAQVWIVRPVLEGQSRTAADANPFVPLECGGPDYFRTFGIPILRGRGFTDDDDTHAPKVAVVSEAVARRFWQGEDPIGKHLRFAGADTSMRTVVGVAGDVRFRRLRHATPTIYLPWRQSYTLGYVALRTRGTLASVLPAVRRTVGNFGAQFGVGRALTMDDYLAGPLAQPRLSALLLSGFGIVALLLAAIGLYGVMATAVREQRRDMGIRLALGATPGHLRRQVIGNALVVTALGAVVGLGAALASSRLLASLLFEVSPSDPVTLLGVAVLLVAVGAAAAYLPARRATRVDPAQVLRAE